MRPVRYAIVALAMLTLAGCTDKKCLQGDSATTCQALTKCFDGGEPVEGVPPDRARPSRVRAELQEKHCPRLYRGRCGPELRPPTRRLRSH